MSVSSIRQRFIDSVDKENSADVWNGIVSNAVAGGLVGGLTGSLGVTILVILASYFAGAAARIVVLVMQDAKRR